MVWSDGVEDSNAIDPGVFRDPDRRHAVAHLRLLLRLHPPGRARSEDRTSGCIPASKPVNVAINSEASIMIVPRRLVLPAGHARVVLRRRQLQLQHPHGPVAQGDRPVPRQHGHRHAPGRRQAVRRVERPPHRPRALRPARPRRRRPEVLPPLRSRPRSRRHQRARHPPAALARRLAGRRRATSRPAPTRSSRRAPARRSSWPCRACRWAARGRGGPGGGPGGPDGRSVGRGAHAPPPIPPQEPSQVGQLAGRAASTCAWRPTCCRRSRSGRSHRSPNAGGYPGSPYFKITDRRHRSRAGGDGGSPS